MFEIISSDITATNLALKCVKCGKVLLVDTNVAYQSNLMCVCELKEMNSSEKLLEELLKNIDVREREHEISSEDGMVRITEDFKGFDFDELEEKELKEELYDIDDEEEIEEELEEDTSIVFSDFLEEILALIKIDESDCIRLQKKLDKPKKGIVSISLDGKKKALSSGYTLLVNYDVSENDIDSRYRIINKRGKLIKRKSSRGHVGKNGWKLGKLYLPIKTISKISKQ